MRQERATTVNGQRATTNEPLTADNHWIRSGYILIAVIFIARLIYLATDQIELSEDEAYQWLWSKHLALSYFSKPPLIAYAQWLGTHLFGDTQFGVRFFSPVCAAIGSLAVLRFFSRNANSRAGFWLIAVFNVIPLLAVGSTLLTVDPLLVLFWTLAMLAGWRAVQPDGRTIDWIQVGVWMGFAFLSKYTALLQWVCWILFFILWRPARIHLRRPGPYLALFVNALLALPVIIWNAQHEWITAAHVANDAKLNEAWRFNIGNFFEFLGGAFGLLHPMVFVAMAWAAIAGWRYCKNQTLFRYFFAMGAPVFLVYLFYTLHSRVLVNWIAASVVPLLCTTVLYWDERYSARPSKNFRVTFAIAMIAGVIGVVFLHETDLARKFAGRNLPAKLDPLRRVRGWERMAAIVERERGRLSSEGKPVFIIGSHYGTAGLLSFYIPEARATAASDEPLVYYRRTLRPNTQFYFWPDYSETRRGQNALFVRDGFDREPPPRDMLKQFTSVTEVGFFPIMYRGRVLHRVQIFACRDLR